MSEDQDDSQKTEEPSHKRLEEAQKKGQIAFSREVNSFLLLFVFTILVMGLSPALMRDTRDVLAVFISDPDMFETDAGSLGLMLTDLLGKSALILIVPMIATIAAALLGGFSQNHFTFSTEPITPKFEKISPLKGLGRMFSSRSVVEFIKGLLKLSIVGIACTMAIWSQLDELKLIHDYSIPALLEFIGMLSGRVLITVCIIMFVVAGLDYFYQYFEFRKKLRMSKQELKDEYKQQEGDPMIKQRLRALRMERAKKRMMAEVPSSDVVITNPTHFAVALKYDPLAMGAPKLVAKGADHIALKIREIAEDNKIPVIQNPPLARSLYQAELDKEIPLEHYKAVAEIIGYVYKLKGKKLPGSAPKPGQRK